MEHQPVAALPTGQKMPDLDFVRQEIEHMRVRVGRRQPARRLGALEGEVGRASKMARPQCQLAKARDIAVREGWCNFHVQAIIVAIDQYAEAATGNRQYFQNPPHSTGGSQKAGDVP
jgi:hypothetical protein